MQTGRCACLLVTPAIIRLEVHPFVQDSDHQSSDNLSGDTTLNKVKVGTARATRRIRAHDITEELN